VPDPWLLATDVLLELDRSVVLDAEEARHASGSLRLRPGDEVVLTDARGKVAQAVLRRIDRGGAEAEVLDVEEIPRSGEESVSLALAVLHQARAMDFAVQKAVEIGVGSLIPVISDRTQLGMTASRGRQAHWRRVALQALKQCRRPWAMDIVEPTALADLVERRGAGGGVVADPTGSSLADLPMSDSPLLLVGPEGGFAPEEMEMLTPERWPRLRLGPYVLRSETAAVVGAAMVAARRSMGER
jgi:16S rRNA (uracil1498-N3)-methyltransferase